MTPCSVLRRRRSPIESSNCGIPAPVVAEIHAARPALERIAGQHGLSYGITDMLSVYEADASEGFAKDFAVAFLSRSSLPLWEMQGEAMNRRTQLQTASPGTSYLADSEKNGYLCWKIKEKRSHVPDLSAIRDKAIAAWKMTRARDLAGKQAEEYAEQAREHGGKLKRVFTDELAEQVIEPDAFSWLKVTVNFDWFQRTGQIRMTPQLNLPIDGVEYVSGDFLEKIFALEPGGVEVEFDYPQEIVYVVRMTSIDPANSRQLLTNIEQARDVSRAESFAVGLDWDKALEIEFEVDWK